MRDVYDGVTQEEHEVPHLKERYLKIKEELKFGGDLLSMELHPVEKLEGMGKSLVFTAEENGHRVRGSFDVKMDNAGCVYKPDDGPFSNAQVFVDDKPLSVYATAEYLKTRLRLIRTYWDWKQGKNVKFGWNEAEDAGQAELAIALAKPPK